MDFCRRNNLENTINNACAWVEVDLDAVAENLETVRSLVGPATKVCAVIKADAYGHGVVEVARLLQDRNVDYMAVAVLDEAVELRQMGIRKPILILGPLMPGQAPYVLRYDLTQTICSVEMAEELSREAIRQRKIAKIHVKIDTGMGRLGVFHREAPQFINNIKQLPGIELEGLFTHFATSDSIDKSYLYEQWESFNQVIQDVKAMGIHIPITHCATSATIIDLPFMKLDMVRPGLMLFGLYPREDMKGKVDLKPALTLKARISFLKEIHQERSISYGRKYTARPGQKIATLPMGYYDGYRRLFTNQGKVLAGGVPCPVVGAVCMDHVMVDVTQVPGVRRFDEVVIIGAQGDHRITVNDLAETLSTINYEVLAALGRRLPRIFHRKGHVVGVRNLAGYHSDQVAFTTFETPIPGAKSARDTDTMEMEVSGLSG